MITVKFFEYLHSQMAPKYISNQVRKFLSKIPVNTLNWSEYNYLPKVNTSIAQINDGLYIHFEVNELYCEPNIKRNNGKVYNDSCVEFFIDIANDGSYYNFEINSIGKILMGYGTSRENRELSELSNLKNIKREVIISHLNTDKVKWELTLIIPYHVFFKHQLQVIHNENRLANIYKCGNKTPIPHFVTWNPIKNPRPDFHRPEDFGSLYFE